MNFGLCSIGTEKELEFVVENRNSHVSKLLMTCPIISQFVLNPREFTLMTGESKVVTVKFVPRNLGNLKLAANFLINKEYKITIFLNASSESKKGTAIIHKPSAY